MRFVVATGRVAVGDATDTETWSSCEVVIQEAIVGAEGDFEVGRRLVVAAVVWKV